MKLFDNIFSSIYLFFEAIDDGRPGNKGNSIIGVIFVLTLTLAANILSFYSAEEMKRIPGLFYLIVVVVCSVLIALFYRKKRYIGVVKQFETKKNKSIYYFITIMYILLSFTIFYKTR